MGEHIEENAFRISEITIQYQHGTRFYFIRQMKQAFGQLKSFFHRTNHNYKKYNYLGEWHSHPNFVTQPSNRDNRTMLEIVEDPLVGANFAILLIVRISSLQLEARAVLYLPRKPPIEVELRQEPN